MSTRELARAIRSDPEMIMGWLPLVGIMIMIGCILAGIVIDLSADPIPCDGVIIPAPRDLTFTGEVCIP